MLIHKLVVLKHLDQPMGIRSVEDEDGVKLGISMSVEVGIDQSIVQHVNNLQQQLEEVFWGSLIAQVCQVNSLMRIFPVADVHDHRRNLEGLMSALVSGENGVMDMIGGVGL